MFAIETQEDFRISKGLEILGLDLDIEKETKEFILNEITKYIFETSSTIKVASEKIFDYELDYKYYYSDFKKCGIDLNRDNITWWEFDTLLQGIFLTEETVIGKVIQYRTYKKSVKSQKAAELEEHRYYMERKRQFALPQKEQKIDENLNKLWSFVSNKIKKGE